MCQTSLVVLVKTRNFRCRECALVQSLVGELRYSMPHYVAKKKKEKTFMCSKPGEVSVTWYPTVHGDCGSCLRSDRQAPSQVTPMHFLLTILWASFHTKIHFPIIFDWLPTSPCHLCVHTSSSQVLSSPSLDLFNQCLVPPLIAVD